MTSKSAARFQFASEPMKRKNENAEAFLTPPEVAKLLRVSTEKVLGWIRRAELRAVNVSNSSRPRYRVSRDSLDEFLESREVQPPAPRARRRRHKYDGAPNGGPIDPILGEKLFKTGQATKVGKKYYRVWNGMTLYV